MTPSAELLELLDGVKIYAHRGDWRRGIPENSLKAIGIAVDKGFGLELDVHLLADGNLAVFHDHSLFRMCGKRGRIEELNAQQLKECRLRGTQETIPTFREVLDLVAGRVPILIELKCFNNQIALCDTLIETLNGYSGKYMFIGFDEIAAEYFKKKGYTIALSCFKPKLPERDFSPDALLCNIYGIPDSEEETDKLPPLISWTVSSKKMKAKSDRLCVATIYNTKHFDF